MTAIIDALEARDLVRRERHEVDRRFISVYLTEAGRVLLADAAPARASAVVALMRELNGEQKERLTRLCGRLLRVLDPDPREDAPAETDDSVSATDAGDEEAGDVGEAGDGDASVSSEPAPVDVASEDAAG